jgi:hypothetical protein
MSELNPARRAAAGRRPPGLGWATGLALFGVLAGGLPAQTSLVYLELQMVGAYATPSDRIELFSLMPEDVMQKPSAGFDFLQRLPGRTRDLGLLSVQARLAFGQAGPKLEPQLYNAYVRFKPRLLNVWIGHNRPAMGLSSVLDNHALLLPDPAMLGFGFDRDWGAGLDRDFAWGGVAASLTAGSGMSLRLHGSYLAAARVFKGVLARDNYSIGLSLSRGRMFETMGYEIPEPEPASWTAAGLDVSSVWRNLENRAELLLGRRDGAGTVLLFCRSGLSLLEEGRLKLEAQPALARRDGQWHYSLGSGLTYLLSADLSGRFMVFYDQARRGTKFVAQLYYYKRL